MTLDTALHYANQPLNERRAKGYLNFFSKIYSEGFATGMIDLDTIIRQMPEKATIDVRGANGYHQQVRIIYFPLDRRSKNTDVPITTFDDNFHSDRYFAILNDGKDTATVQIPTFEKILRRGYEFFTPDEVPKPKPNSELPGSIKSGTH